MIKKTRDKAKTLEIINIDFICGALNTIELKDAYYDVVLMVCIWGEIPETQHRFCFGKNSQKFIKKRNYFSNGDYF